MNMRKIGHSTRTIVIAVGLLILSTVESWAVFSVTWTSSTKTTDGNFLTWSDMQPGFFVIGYREGWPEQWFIEIGGSSISLDMRNKAILWHVDRFASYNWHTVGAINLQLTFLDTNGGAMFTSNTDFNFGTSCYLHQPYTQRLAGFPDHLEKIATVQLNFIGSRDIWQKNNNNDCQPGDNP